MTSPCSTPLEHPVSQSALAPKAVIMPPLPQTLSPSESDFSPHPLSLQILIPPPPPPPPPPPIKGTAPPHVFGMEKSQLLKEALEKAGPVPRGREDIKRLLKLHKDRFRSDLQWILFCADLPSLIQEGPQCGLVALWMAGTLLVPPGGIPLESLVQVAKERGYTAQGEMFSVADMGKLAQEVLGCQAELLCGGLGSPNRDRVLQHLIAGQPLLIPYDEDFNHEPCQRRGHKAHWAVSAGGSPPQATAAASPSPHSPPNRLCTPEAGTRLGHPNLHRAPGMDLTGGSCLKGLPSRVTTHRLKDQTAWAPGLAETLPGSVMLGKCLYLSEPPFPHEQSGSGSNPREQVRRLEWWYLLHLLSVGCR
ncbi:actin maturation protease isoform X1 [Dasypus novemcinctus]|uniref:actin maturation protease isoform X1 n=1 Tax=Dasypus novemcinctus TaxID=9361 RepID=UPI0003289B99|nr:actin maturation protease isoform X1 [Dasypus novemcinctus]XP_023444691.1 actin maturation protease isoform X1 [Dasypus novemcinctus]XP_023444692.1 actin maturation protease isoform X1 [Dasypus novemcinctus]